MGFVRAGFAAFQSLCGIVAFVVFLHMQLYPGAIYGFIAAACNGIISHINWLHAKRKLILWYEYKEIDQLFWFGFWIAGLGTIGLVYFGIQQAILWVYSVQIVNVVWPTLTIISGCVLMRNCNRLLKDHEMQRTLIVEA